MAKDTFYFSHDYNARNDVKIKLLIRKHKFLGYGIYWGIIEDLYNNTNVLPIDYEGISDDFKTSQIIIKSILHDFDLFEINEKTFGSLSVQRRLDERASKSNRAKDSINKRWEKVKLENTNVLQSNNERNTIKERKGKEIKDNIDSRKLKFASTLQPFLSDYGKDLLNNFYGYWTEPNKSKSKFRQELEKTWDVKRRLETWAENDKTFNKKVVTNSNHDTDGLL